MEFAITQPKLVRLSWYEKQTYWLNFWPWMCPSDLALTMTLTMNFQCQIWNLPILSPKWSNCREIKSKYIDWTPGIKCNYWVWPWLWSWPWIFKVKFWNSRISGIGGPIDIEQKGVIHDNDHDILVTKMRWKDLPDSNRGDLRCWRAIDSSSYFGVFWRNQTCHCRTPLYLGPVGLYM